MSAGFPRIPPRRRNPDEAPKLTWYVATFQVLFILAFLIALVVGFILLMNWMLH